MTFSENNLCRGRDYVVNKNIVLHHPTLDQMFDPDYGEEKYWNFVSAVCATPADLKHQLFDNCGKNFDQVDEFDLFCMLCGGFEKSTSGIIFGDLDFQKLSLGINQKTQQKVIFDPDSDLVIDKAVYTIITEYLRKVDGLKKNVEHAGNDLTRKIMIDLSRSDAKRNGDKPFTSILMSSISALVNCADFKYNYDTVWDLPIYAFLDSRKRILHSKNINYTLQGIYAGTIVADKIDKKELDWLGEI